MWPLLVVLVVAVLGVTLYNGLVKLRERAEGAWADIDVQLKRRYDLIPNLVETVKGYASHERETLEAVISARSQAMAAQGPAEKGQAEGMLAGALKSLFALAEAYPQLQAAEGFRDLQRQLTDLEGHIAQARKYYNAVVRDYNTRTQTFPGVLVANAFGFHQREFFEVPDAEREAPRVSFGDDA